ncbi:MAG TPA: hypothetical protein VGR70_20845, partial [Stellaceae bacterium]|nr:hypothetical protein [Stellaceae bacterium]
GFWQGMEAAYSAISQARRPGAPLYIVAHSLGAAHAADFLALNRLAGAPSVSSTLLLGCPRPGTATLAEFLASETITSLRNWGGEFDHDPVTDVPPDVPLARFTPVRGYLDVNAPPATDDEWGDVLARHHAELYWQGWLALQQAATERPTLVPVK